MKVMYLVVLLSFSFSFSCQAQNYIKNRYEKIIIEFINETEKQSEVMSKKEELRDRLSSIMLDTTTSSDVKLEMLLLVFLADQASSSVRWAKNRRDACRVREEIAIRWMIDVWCDIEGDSEELEEQAIKEFRTKNPL